MNKLLIESDPDKIWDIENLFYWFASVERFSKFLTHYELYKKIVSIPGDIAEFGVYKGCSLISFCIFRSLLEDSTARRIWGFDAFGKFPNVSEPVDQDFVKGFEKAGGDGLSTDEISKILSQRNLLANVNLVAGDIKVSLRKTLAENPEVRFSLIHVDVDVYEPTEEILAQCFDRVCRGGLIVFDDYGKVFGETRAVDEFLARRPGIRLQRLPFSHKSTYFEKE